MAERQIMNRVFDGFCVGGVSTRLPAEGSELFVKAWFNKDIEKSQRNSWHFSKTIGAVSFITETPLLL